MGLGWPLLVLEGTGGMLGVDPSEYKEIKQWKQSPNDNIILEKLHYLLLSKIFWLPEKIKVSSKKKWDIPLY